MIGSPMDTERRIDAWMEAEAPLRAPVELLETVFAATSRSTQRRRLPTFVAWRPGGTGRPVAILLVALALVVLVIVGSLMLGGGRADVEPTHRPSRAGTPEVSAATIQARIPIPGAVSGMAFGSATTADSVWVTSDLAVVRIDPATNGSLSVPEPVAADSLGGIAANATSVYIGDRTGDAVYRIDPATNAVAERITVVGGPFALVADGSSVWVLLRDSGQIARIGAATNTVEATFQAPPGATTIALALGDLWVATTGGQLVRIDPATGTVGATVQIPAGVGPCGGTAVASEVWTGCFSSTLIGRVDPATNTYAGDVDAGGAVAGMVAVGQTVWVAEPPDGARPGRLVSIDPIGIDIDRILTLGPTDDPDIPVVLSGSIWVPVEGENEVLRVKLPTDAPP